MSSTTDLAKYLVALELQNAQYIQKLDSTQSKLDSFHRQQERAVAKIKSSFLKLGSSLAAAFSVRAIVQFTAESVKLADEIAKISRAAGVSAESLQELRFALGELGGVTAGQVDQGLQRFNRQIGLAAIGNKRAADTLKLLGVAFKDSTGGARDTEVVLNDALRALAGITDDARRAALAARLFGDEIGPKLSAALEGGIENLNQTRDAVAGLITDERVAEAEALNDAFERIAKTIGGTLRSAAIETTADLADLLGILDRGPAGDLRTQIEDVERRIAAFKAAASAGSLGGNQVLLDEAEAQLRRLQTALKIEENRTPFVERRREWRSGGERLAEDFVGGFGSRIGDVYDKFPKLNLKRPELDLDLLPEDGLQEIVVGAKRLSLDDLIKPFPAESVDRMFNPIDEKGKETAAAVGSYFQDAFADWMLGADRSFGDLLKRMAAQMATSALFKGLASMFSGSTSGVGKFFGDFFGGARASGGPVAAGHGYLVGESGPEMFVPGMSGSIIPHGTGGMTFAPVTHIDARGADPGLISRLPAILEANNQRLMAKMQDLNKRGRF